MSSGRRRAITVLCGWLIANAAIGAIMVFVQWSLAQPRTIERRPVVHQVVRPDPGDPLLIAAAVGAIMLSYGLSLAAASEILKANVGRFDAGVALAVFAVTLKQRSPKARRPRRALRARGTSPRWRPASPSGRAENGGLAAPPSRAEQT